MTWRSAIALAALLQAGCLETRDDDGRCLHEWSRPLEAGEQVNGHDPVELLAPYAGRWHGTVTWRDGQVTDIDIDISSDPPSPLSAYMFCDRLGLVNTQRPVTVSTADGALNDSALMAASVRFPVDGTSSQRTPQLSPLMGPFGPPASTLVDRDLYQDGHILIEFIWNTPTSPAGGRLLFVGQLKGITLSDQIELGTIVF
ncbi:hypothetical protein [Sorangium cellulosum]|uniref:Uncharacterized protein n=1 Tax=Sorangium cellulosum TaxID=56 RepID=A0A150QFD1_SORCE|nr:hypothetical protein [Sorangium cellulosum]KYF66582.1 hypothetical protein BE15_21440 [Sorangium cellulosum]